MGRYRRELEAARRRLAERERHSIQTRYGSIEYGERGTGPPLLFSHVLFGGFDLGLGSAEAYLGDGFRVIAPSRFGYLGSSLPAGGTPADQANAYAVLLDALRIERTAVVGFSAGGPSVIQFALHHPTGPAGWSCWVRPFPARPGGSRAGRAAPVWVRSRLLDAEGLPAVAVREVAGDAQGLLPDPRGAADDPGGTRGSRDGVRGRRLRP